MLSRHPEFRNSAVVAFIVHDRYRALRHVALCSGFLAILFYSSWVNEYEDSDRFIRPLFVFVVLTAMFYVNMYVLVPKFFFKGRYMLYLIFVVILVKVGLNMVSYLLTSYFGPDNPALNRIKSSRSRSEYEGMLIVIPIILMTTTIKLFQRWTIDNERIAELNRLNMTMELNGLRNQINPHFLFNMLNGIKALVRVDQEKAITVIMKFADLLRYQLYENNENRTLLRNEINFISNFLNLEKLRRDNLLIDIQYSSVSTNLNEVLLPPNLFTTFIENAVKHSAAIQNENSFIRVNIEVMENKLKFTCENSTDPLYVSSSASSGLGLPNIKRRLNLLYENRHELEIRSTNQCYTVHLTILI